MTLNSTKDEIEAVFGARGWHDLSQSTNSRDGSVIEEIYFHKTYTSQEMAANSKERLIGHFQKSLKGGQVVGLSFQDTFPTTESMQDMIDMIGDICIKFSERFKVTGCLPKRPGSRAASVILEPKVRPKGEWCQVSIGVRINTRPASFGYAISRQGYLPQGNKAEGDRKGVPRHGY
ncbi:MAG: hypothetical protein KDI90_06485 [Alphaproteobacteria bacterium]|nr:hypothetical protein [Alphaproteobacteria bacterium]MCB9975058.1 hypothetical protein [Rhodospirillales bacterium]